MNVLNEWRELTLSQFYGKRVLDGIIRAMSEVLQGVYEEQQELRHLLDIDAMEGANLDIIGDIVCLSRGDARNLFRREEGVMLTDESYRKALKYKIILNNAGATYFDIIRGIDLIWNTSDVLYREERNRSATYILDLMNQDIENDNALSARTTTIKAGGVKVLFVVTWLLAFAHPYWKVRTVSNAAALAMRFFDENVRKLDGSWKLDGAFKLDAAVSHILRVENYCAPIKEPGKIGIHRVHDIPDRLKITSSSPLTCVSTESAIIGSRGNIMSVEVDTERDSLVVYSAGKPTVLDYKEWACVDGELERTGKMQDYIVSDLEIYAEPVDDGICICFAADMTMELEIAPTLLI